MHGSLGLDNALSGRKFVVSRFHHVPISPSASLGLRVAEFIFRPHDVELV